MDCLTTQNIYRSPKKKIPFLARKLPSLFFYPKMVSVVWKSSRFAKMGKFTGQKWIEASLGIVRALESVGVRLEVENLASFQKLKTPCVFIGNHMSTLETFVLPCIIQPFRDITFIVKESLLKYPVFKHILINLNSIGISRSDPREDLRIVLEQGPERLSRNISIVVFPQTTRVVSAALKKFNTIGVKIAKRAGAPVIPIALKTDAWSNGPLIKDFGKIRPEKPVRISFGDPIKITGNGKEEHEYIVKFISDKLRKWF